MMGHDATAEEIKKMYRRVFFIKSLIFPRYLF